MTGRELLLEWLKERYPEMPLEANNLEDFIFDTYDISEFSNWIADKKNKEDTNSKPDNPAKTQDVYKCTFYRNPNWIVNIKF